MARRSCASISIVRIFLYVMPRLLIGISAELRYMCWPILVSLLLPVILIDGVRQRRTGAGGG